MLRREFLFRLTGSGVHCGIACSALGCGTLLHSERCGRPRGSRLDWAVVALDGLGLILFFVPGVIAFVVDFSTGAIYLPESEPPFPNYPPPPPEAVPALSSQPPGAMPTIKRTTHLVSAPTARHDFPAKSIDGPADLKRVLIIPDEFSQQRIEQVVTNHVGRTVCLDIADARVSPLRRLDQFTNQWLHHRTNHGYGSPARTFFDGLQRA
jgi:hypothetical protein